MREMTEAVFNFLTEYLSLCNKHNMYIGSCGCCDGVRVTEKGDNDSTMVTKDQGERIQLNLKELIENHVGSWIDADPDRDKFGQQVNTILTKINQAYPWLGYH